VCHVVSCHVMLDHAIMLYDVCHVVPCYVILGHATMLC
jgi:hypothetical protein